MDKAPMIDLASVDAAFTRIRERTVKLNQRTAALQVRADAVYCDRLKEKKERREREGAGGRRDEDHDGPQTRITRAVPDLVCWSSPAGWHVGVQVERHDGIFVQQGQVVLSGEKSDCVVLDNVRDDVVATEGGEEKWRVPVGEAQYLLFKLVGEKRDWGRRVRSISHGVYLLVVPQDWHIEPEHGKENVSLVGFVAYFVEIAGDDESSVTFATPDGSRIDPPSTAPRFRLVGNELADVTDDMGPLFGGDAPEIERLRDDAEREASFCVVGEEGRRTRGWSTSFDSWNGLRKALAGRVGGWYYLRLYDKARSLLESHQFRFFRALRKIAITSQPVPGEEGHKPATVEFVHESACTIAPLSAGEGVQQLPGETGNCKTHFTVPANPTLDVVDWEVSHDKEKLQIKTRIERVWWSQDPQNWTSKPMQMPQDALRADSAVTVSVWLPTPRWVNSVEVRFSDNEPRSYQAAVTNREVRIPLRDFCDQEEASKLTATFRRGEELVGTCCLFTVSRNPPPQPPPPPNPAPALPDPRTAPCCFTCDHCRALRRNRWCRQGHWGLCCESEFSNLHETYVCLNWEGEYYDSRGNYHDE